MTSLLEAALDELAAHLGASRALVETGVQRVDVTSGGALEVAYEDGAGARWFCFDDRGLIERHPAADARLPFSRCLGPRHRVLAYRPGRRVVVAHLRKGAECVTKGYRKRRSAEAARRHRTALRACGRSGFRVPLLLSHERAAEALVFQGLEGQPMSLEAKGAEAFFRIGAALREFQSFEGSEPLAEHGVEDELGVLATWRRRVLLARGELPQGWDAALLRIRAAAQGLPPARLGLCHRDLHDGQLLDTELGTALLDHDLLCRADTALDPANLLAHLALRGLQGLCGADPASTRLCGEALLDGYDGSEEGGFWERLRVHQALTFLRLALIYSIRPRWSSLSAPLMGFADRCLEDVGRVEVEG